MSEQCKGFWSMCACADCRKRDRELDKLREEDPLKFKSLTHKLGDALAKAMKP